MQHLSTHEDAQTFFIRRFAVFFLSQDSWQKIIMNFITNLSFNKRSNDVYDSVFVIINRYIKMTFYIFVTKNIIAIKLAKIIFDHVMLKYDASENVVSNKEFVFTSAYWTNICYHMKMKRQLNIIFHSQIDDQTERQNQNLKHFLRMFCFEKQIEWIKFLFLIEFVYQNSVQFIIECNLFFCMYDYNFEIRYESKDDIIMKRMLVVTKRVICKRVKCVVTFVLNVRKNNSMLTRWIHDERRNNQSVLYVSFSYE
jgi:hypothetical protein